LIYRPTRHNAIDTMQRLIDTNSFRTEAAQAATVGAWLKPMHFGRPVSYNSALAGRCPR
jgi:hypothetical protein